MSVSTSAARPFFPHQYGVEGKKIRDLRYGENPHQQASWYQTAPYGFGDALILQGKEPSYTNLLDADAAARIVLEFMEPAVAIIKHTNPTGVALGSTAGEAYFCAREADRLASFGGIGAFNRPISLGAARHIVETFMEVVIAPAVEEEAREVLATKPNLRVLTANFNPFVSTAKYAEVRSIMGALLTQQRDRVVEADEGWPTKNTKVMTKREPTDTEWAAMRFAWRVMAHVKSNAVIFTDEEKTLAIGSGMGSRVESVKVALMKATQPSINGKQMTIPLPVPKLIGSAAASDAFFPFRDGLDAVAAAGATCVVQPGGSERDAEVIAAADEHDMAMVFTGRRHFRH